MTRPIEAFSLVAPLASYCALIFTISALSAPPAPDYPFAWGDKLVHAAAYAAMLVLAVRAARVMPSRPALVDRLLPAILFCVVYGASDELHQYFVPGRSCVEKLAKEVTGQSPDIIAKMKTLLAK